MGLLRAKKSVRRGVNRGLHLMRFRCVAAVFHGILWSRCMVCDCWFVAGGMLMGFRSYDDSVSAGFNDGRRGFSWLLVYFWNWLIGANSVSCKEATILDGFAWRWWTQYGMDNMVGFDIVVRDINQTGNPSWNRSYMTIPYCLFFTEVGVGRDRQPTYSGSNSTFLSAFGSSTLFWVQVYDTWIDRI